MILMYHNVGSAQEINTLSIPHFQEHVEYLKSSGHNIVSLKTYVENLHERNKSITVTFDDAYVSILDPILPMMKDAGIPFSVFVPVDFVGLHNKWDVEEGDNISHIMNWEQLSKISEEEYITIGSHGKSHTSFGQLSSEEIESELYESKHILEDKLNIRVNYFAYPYGQLKDLGRDTAFKLKELGYRAGLTTIWGKQNSIDDVYRLRRMEIQVGDDANALKRKMETSTTYRLIKQTLKNRLYQVGLWK